MIKNKLPEVNVSEGPKGWKELPLAGVITEKRSAAKYNTGDWRVEIPILDKDKCIHCMFCFINCPDSAVVVKDGKMEGFEYLHCKGCGICAYVCPKDAITMKKEEK